MFYSKRIFIIKDSDDDDDDDDDQVTKSSH